MSREYYSLYDFVCLVVLLDWQQHRPLSAALGAVGKDPRCGRRWIVRTRGGRRRMEEVSRHIEDYGLLVARAVDSCSGGQTVDGPSSPTSDCGREAVEQVVEKASEIDRWEWS